MSEHVFDTFTLEEFTGKLFSDDDPQNPRENDDNFGKMVCWHRNYILGDKHDFKTPDDFQEWLDEHKVAVILPLYLYDHSGITMRTGPFSCPWDSGQVGWVYVTREDILKEYGGKRVTKKMLKDTEKVLQCEVETYDQYLTNDVYGYVIEDATGEDVDSCWGFFGYAYAVGEMQSAVKCRVAGQNKEFNVLRGQIEHLIVQCSA